MAWSLCTKEDVASIFPVSAAALQDFWSDAVEALIREHLGAPYIGLSDVAIIDEVYSGDGTRRLMLRSLPIISVESLVISGLTSEAASYVVSSTGIVLVYTEFPVGVGNVKVSYTVGSQAGAGGNITIDPIIRLCAATMVAAIATFKGRGGSDASVKWASAGQREGGPAPMLESGLITGLNKIMRNMLKRKRLRIK